MEQKETEISTIGLVSKENFILNYGKFSKKDNGVYKIEIGDYLYIGSAAGKQGFSSRWSKHISELIKNKHSNPILQNVFNKYKYAKFSIIEICAKEMCISREQFYIDSLNPNINIRRIADSPLGVKQSKESIDKRTAKIRGQKRTREQKECMSKAHILLMNSENSPYNEEWKQKMRIANIGKTASEETKQKISAASKGNTRAAKPILQYTKDNKFIREWESAKIAKDTLNIKGNICECLKGHRKTASGFIWKYKN